MERKAFLDKIDRYFASHSIVALLGPRQCGKTTLARMYCAGAGDFQNINYFDLESPVDVSRLENPALMLKELKGLVVIDEIQRLPDLFPLLRVLVDNPSLSQRYLILGSASRELIRQSSESLAGRIAYVELTPFVFAETKELETLWLRGGYPRSYLASTEQESRDWREFYIRTFLEQDIPNLGFDIAPATLRRFWTMLAHYHGNIFNASELGRSLGLSDPTIRRYLDILCGTFMVRQLQPWYVNMKKRQVKSPKIYFRDSGIFHQLLGVADHHALLVNPKLGASWEGFAMEQVIQASDIRYEDCYFWSTHSGAELDLFIQKPEGAVGFEFKYTAAPKITKSMVIAGQDLDLTQLYVVYPGDVDYPLDERVTATGLSNCLNKLTKK